MELHPLVGVVMGSKSDFGVLEPAVEVLREFSIPHEVAGGVPRTGLRTGCFNMPRRPKGGGLQVIIAGAGGAAHLPGMLAAKTLGGPVLGVPVPATVLQGMDSLLSIVQMPKGVPVGTLAIGRPGGGERGLCSPPRFWRCMTRTFGGG